MSDLEAAYRERHLVDTPSGKLMTGQLAAMPPEALDQAYSDAHVAAYGKRPDPNWRWINVPAGADNASPDGFWGFTPADGGIGIVIGPGRPEAGNPVNGGVASPAETATTTPFADPRFNPRATVAIAEGLSTAVAQMWQTVNELAQFGVKASGVLDKLSMPTMAGEGRAQAPAQLQQWAMLRDMPSGEPPEGVTLPDKSMVEEILTGGTQFMVPFVAISRMLGGAQLFKAAGADAGMIERAARYLGNAVTRGAAASVPVDFAAFDPAENNLVDIAKQFGFESELTAFLESADTGGDTGKQLENRVRAAVSNLAAGGALEVGVDAVKGLSSEAFMRAARAARAVRNYKWDQVERDASAQLRSVLSPGRMNEGLPLDALWPAAKLMAAKALRKKAPKVSAIDEALGQLSPRDQVRAEMLANEIIATGGKDLHTEGEKKAAKAAMRKVEKDPRVKVGKHGARVSDENLHGLMPALRVKVSSTRSMPRTGMGQKTKNANAEQQLNLVDRTLALHEYPEESVEAWADMMRTALASDEVPIPPYAFIENLKGGYAKMLAELTPRQIADAQAGFDNGAEFLKLYSEGAFTAGDTGRLFMWSFLSRGVLPFTQEAMFLDALDGVREYVDLAAAGKFDDAALERYLEWAKNIDNEGSPGRGTAHNLNAFGKSFLKRMSQPVGNGDKRSRLQYLHDLMSDPTKTGREIRREFVRLGEGVGIDNKVVSFTLLVTGRTDVMVLDRVQIRATFDDGRFKDRNLYDGINRTSIRTAQGESIAFDLDLPGETIDGRKSRIEDLKQALAERRGEDPSTYETQRVNVPGSMLARLFDGARGLLHYEAMERALDRKLEGIYTELGRPQDASPGRLHWESWVVSSQQEASHGTLDVVLYEAEGMLDEAAQATVRQGEYGAFQYGARYGRDDKGGYFLYPDSTGAYYRFTIPEFREFLAGIKVRSNGIIPSKFKVSESGNRPWFEQAGVDRAKLDELVRRIGSAPGAPPKVNPAGAADGPGRGPADGSPRQPVGGVTPPSSAPAGDSIEILARGTDGRATEVAITRGGKRRVAQVAGRGADGRVSRINLKE